MLNVGLQQQQQIRGADGTILWAGAQVVGVPYTCLNTGSVAIKLADVVTWDATNSVIPRPETTAAGSTPSSDLPMSLVLGVIQGPASAGSVNPLGVAQDPAGVNKLLSVAGPGSIVCVGTTAVTLAIGAFVSTSATAGLAAATVVGAATNTVLGAVFKINQVASPGTGSTGFAGIHVKGGSAAIT